MPEWLRLIGLVLVVLIVWTLVGMLCWWIIVRAAPKLTESLVALLDLWRR